MTINQGAEPTTGYLFCHFTGAEQKPTDEQLYFALSRDGIHWHDLHADGDPVLTSPLGERGVRDPFVVRAPGDGGFYILATDLSIHDRGGTWVNCDAAQTGSTDLIVWHSDDLVHWSEPWALDVASRIPGAGCAWAPEAIWDETRGQYMLYWATWSEESNELGHPTNMYYATTTDFRTVSEPVKWIDRQREFIDTTMLRDGDWYYRVSAGDGRLHIERTKNPYAVSVAPYCDDLRGAGEDEWAFVGNLDTYFGRGAEFARLCGELPDSNLLEGPELFRFNDADATLPDGRRMPFGLIGDRHAEKEGYIAFRSADLNSTDTADWAAANIDFGVMKKRHGAILPITTAEYDALEAAWGEGRRP